MDLFTLAFFGLALVLIGSLWSRASERRIARTERKPTRAQETSGPFQPAGGTLTKWTRIEPTGRIGVGVRAASTRIAPLQGYAKSSTSFDRMKPGARSANRAERPPAITSP